MNIQFCFYITNWNQILMKDWSLKSRSQCLPVNMRMLTFLKQNYCLKYLINNIFQDIGESWIRKLNNQKCGLFPLPSLFVKMAVTMCVQILVFEISRPWLCSMVLFPILNPVRQRLAHSEGKISSHQIVLDVSVKILTVYVYIPFLQMSLKSGWRNEMLQL